MRGLHVYRSPSSGGEASSVLLSLLLLLLIPNDGGVARVMVMVVALQPRVTTVESHPARRVFGSLSMPNGSPWCDGRPTYWLVRLLFLP
jgi:hypothetical protein